MPPAIESITDRRLFQNILQKLFINKISFIRSSHGNIEVKFIEAEKGLVKIQIPEIVQEPKNCMAFTRQGNNVIFAYLKYCEQKTNNIYVFNPAKFQVISTSRSDERQYIAGASENRYILYATNLISEITMNKSLSYQNEKLLRIKEIIEYNVKNEYDNFRIFFFNEDPHDTRMKYFRTNRTPIFIPDITSPDADTSEDYKNYINFIYNSDLFLNKNKMLVSEISVPVYFDSKIPYGYIQANKSKPFTASSVASLKRLATLIDDLIRKNKLFPALPDKMLISDLSKKGIGIVFKNANYIPYYKKDTFVSLDIMLPALKKASLLADVKHLEMMRNKIIKVGFEIMDMDTASMKNYERFLGSIHAAV
ncbi:MAG: DUF1577 domain-containing protein [Spirochaetes bacterium]|nr:DUF1577 domain-containing protein [Spirochaetota bacterium]